jgi:isopenicillin-N N-acyltransferase like protein
MTDRQLLPVLQVHGSHRDVGLQIGQACAGAVRAAVDFSEETPGDGRTLAEQLRLARDYRNITASRLPYLVDELDAVAEGADVDPLHVFAASIEEIWASPDDVPGTRAGSALGSERGRCSDLVVGPPATAGEALFVAHNNDLDAGVEQHLTALDWNVEGELRMFTIGVGPWISVGWNAAGIVLSGNELAPNDNRVGIPRLLLVREQLRHGTIADATRAALHPDRASAYNTIFADRNGEVVDIEGSATDAATMTLNTAGALVHTNHYVCDSMLGYEDDHAYAKRSERRRQRGAELIDQAAAEPRPITEDLLITMLSDHENAPDSLCRHPVPGDAAKTVFWCVTTLPEVQITFGKGNPCDSVPQKFQFVTA